MRILSNIWSVKLISREPCMLFLFLKKKMGLKNIHFIVISQQFLNKQSNIRTKKKIQMIRVLKFIFISICINIFDKIVLLLIKKEVK